MYEIPVSIEVDDKLYPIRKQGDYRMVLDCFNAFNDVDMDEELRTITALIIFYEDFNSISDVSAVPQETLEKLCVKMSEFINCGVTEHPKTNHILIDWDKDAQLICTAINKVAGKEIRLEPYLHWWTFMGYYMSVGESLLAQVVAIRDKILSNKKLEKHELRFRNDNPQYFVWNHKSVEERQEDEYIKQLWASNSPQER